MSNPKTAKDMVNEINAQNLIKEITGVSMPSTQGPDFNYAWSDSTVTFSISEIGADWQHLGGELSFEGNNTYHRNHNEYQIHRVVSYKGIGVLHYRLCKASEDSPYEAYLVAWFYRTTDDDHQSTVQQMINKGKILCK